MKTFEKNLGTVKTGASKVVVFTLEHPLKIAKDLQTGRLKIMKSCGCMSIGVQKNVVTIRYRPKKVPEHLEKQGYYESKKVATIFHEQQQRQVAYKFIIKAKVIK